VAKNKDKAKAEGFARGLKGKAGPAGMTEAWTDDKAASTARTQGYMEGKRKRMQVEAEKASKAAKDRK
jgi:hypothetical protein